ncbi:alpha/beta fold hydrolase [Kribbella monticola]|uniref:alpha/beta fold hydrolase n=1 Tax=Kribbella monticola TaxID=2185285 RepID=UPI000DD43B6C|nr:alpha/beta fold hydrolase [Kribbella monticola]
MESRKVAAGAHVLLAAVHLYWATGASWPASDERSLSRAVLGGEASFAPQVVLPLAALHLLLATAVLRSARSALARAVVAGLAAGLTARATLGLVWTFTGTGTAFFWLNLFLYTPACVALLVIDVRLLQAKWLKRLVIPLPVFGVVLISLLAYTYQPTAQPSPEPSSDSRYVDTPVARFHYLQRGSGAPVVLLSPGASPASAWQPELDALSKTHAVYVVDLPGQGETRLHGKGFAFDLDAMTGALDQFLDQLHLQQVVLGGNSWSGGWGLAYAQRHPERASKLLLLAPSGLDEPDPASWEILKLPLAGELLAKLGASRSAVQTAVRDLFVHKELVTPALVDKMWVPGTYRDNVRAMYALERGLDWRVTQAALPSTEQPVLIVWGEEDTVLPVAQAARFGNLLPHATVHTLAGCGHALTLDCADRVTRLLEEFVE